MGLKIIKNLKIILNKKIKNKQLLLAVLLDLVYTQYEVGLLPELKVVVPKKNGT
jgi:hypothetical protein